SGDSGDRRLPTQVCATKKRPAMTRQIRVARPTIRGPPLASSDNVARESNPRYDSTATDTAASTAVSEKVSTPVNGVIHPRVGPYWARWTVPRTRTRPRTATSARTTPVITREAILTPARLSPVVSTTARPVNIHTGMVGKIELSAIPVN